MKVLLTIGFHHILLPSDEGVGTVLRTLSRGVPVHDSLYQTPPTLKLEERVLTIEMKLVPANVRVVSGENDQQHVVDLSTPRQIRAAKERLLLPP